MATTFNTNTDNEETWLTPPPLIKSLGEFDLDPCAAKGMPWRTAKKQYTIDDDGLSKIWEGRVWLNPPYGKAMERWLHRMANHAKGIALTFARTDTDVFQRHVFPNYYSIFFVNKRIRFYNIKGERAKQGGNAPSVLISYTEYDAEMIEQSDYLSGHHIYAGVSMLVTAERKEGTWRVIIKDCIVTLGGDCTLQELYDQVIKKAPQKAARNKHYKAKVRQVVQMFHTRKERGVYAI